MHLPRLLLSVLVWMILLLVIGCSSKPARHLAADAALIKPGQSTVEEVIRYLGEPDDRQPLGPGTEQFIYTQDRLSTLARVPYVGSWLGDRESEKLVITIHNGVVTRCEFHQHNEKDRDWADDISWEKVQ